MRRLHLLAFGVLLILVALLAAGVVGLHNSLDTTLPVVPSPDYTDRSSEDEGCGDSRCRKLDGRAAIPVVVARPGGSGFAGSANGSSEFCPLLLKANVFCRRSLAAELADPRIRRSVPCSRHTPTAIADDTATSICAAEFFRQAAAVLEAERCSNSRSSFSPAWLLCTVGAYDVGDAVHVLLLVVLMVVAARVSQCLPRIIAAWPRFC
jgi:hypothetical protein